MFDDRRRHRRTTALTVLRNVAVVGLGVAAADYAFQKRRVMKQLRMTRQEVREEMKQQEGNPEMRRAVRGRRHGDQPQPHDRHGRAWPTSWS